MKSDMEVDSGYTVRDAIIKDGVLVVEPSSDIYPRLVYLRNENDENVEFALQQEGKLMTELPSKFCSNRKCYLPEYVWHFIKTKKGLKHKYNPSNDDLRNLFFWRGTGNRINWRVIKEVESNRISNDLKYRGNLLMAKKSGFHLIADKHNIETTDRGAIISILPTTKYNNRTKKQTGTVDNTHKKKVFIYVYIFSSHS